MSLGIDYAHMDPASALDFAIGLEEDEQLRYREYASCVRDEEIARFFRELGATETLHLRRLTSRRDLLVRHRPPRFDTSISDDEDGERPRRVSARRALEISHRAERSVVEFYGAALIHVNDAELRPYLVEGRLQAEEHRRAIEERLRAMPRRSSR